MSSELDNPWRTTVLPTPLGSAPFFTRLTPQDMPTRVGLFADRNLRYTPPEWVNPNATQPNIFQDILRVLRGR